MEANHNNQKRRKDKFNLYLHLSIYALALIMLGAIALASIFRNVPTRTFTEDLAAIGGIHPLSGVLSTLGILAWCTTASICFFAAALLHRNNKTKESSFLFYSACLTTYLTLDDAFLFHDGLILAIKFLPLNEKIIYALLLTAVVFYLKSFARTILKTNFFYLAVSFAFLSLSVVADATPLSYRLGTWQHLLEDGLKWLGIISWAIYFIQTSFIFAAYENDATFKNQ